jgi:ketosteroid isomerase-like protein
MSSSPLAVARACLQAYVDKDRAAIDAMVAEDFHFTSPLDNALDRATYFRICWPNSAMIARFERIYEFEQGDRAFIVYEAEMSTGRRFRNSEVYTVRGGKLVATEVYFGWDVPHKVPKGTHMEHASEKEVRVS